MIKYQFHEYANLFPMLRDDALDALRKDIRQHGIHDPIVLFDGKILDGRNRFVCAQELGIEAPCVEFEGPDPLAFVVSHNLHRRHLTESQRASVAARVANMRLGDNQHSGGSANWQTLPQVSQPDAARMLNVSDRSVARAKKVQDSAPPEVVRALDEDRISVSLAAKVASLPEELQADIIAAPDLRAAAREAVKPHVAQNSGVDTPTAKACGNAANRGRFCCWLVDTLAAKACGILCSTIQLAETGFHQSQ